MKEVPDSFGNWLAGFIDGEGTFCAYPLKDRPTPRLEFSVKLRGDDRPVLEECCRRTGLGFVRDSGQPKVSVVNRNPESFWRVMAKAEQLELVKLLNKHPLRAKKARDFAIWSRLVFLRHRFPAGSRELNQEISRQMNVLAEELRKVKEYR